MRMPWAKKPLRPPYFAHCEYWVYLPKAKFPPQAALMTRLTHLHPFDRSLPPAIGAPEAMLFSDIRLHMALVLREKNAHVFRPDLFEDHIEPTAEILEALAIAEAFVKIRYASEEPLRDDRHLHLLPYLAECAAGLTRGTVVFDAVSDELLPIETLRARLQQFGRADQPTFHLRTLWLKSARGGMGATRGLVKIGLPELQTPESSNDHQVVIREVLEAAAVKLWETRELPDELTVTAFDDEFAINLSYQKKGPATASIHRIHS
jgi:hypothetical protein